MVQTAELIKTLTNAVGLSGYEASLRDVIRAQFAPLVDEVTVSKVGSIIGVKWGSAPLQATAHAKKLMLAAHADEIGLIVTGIEKGFLRIARVGGADNRILLGQRVLVHPTKRATASAGESRSARAKSGDAQSAPIPGLIASRPPHVLPAAQREKIVGVEDLFIDVGMTEAQAAREIQVGDLVSFDIQTVALKGDLLSGKAMDNRASVATMIVCLDELKHLKHAWDVVAVATAQEETTFAGAKTSAYAIQPDAAIAIDVTFAAQHDYTTHLELGKGPAIAVGPNYHPKMTKRLMDVAKKLEMAYQVEPDVGGGTDAWPIQVSQAGIPVALLGVPLRYMHSPVETVNVKDVERIGRLMAHFAAGLTEEL
ncbi:MAG: M20/M25/M40 family metallo-hydrolase [Chloroflexi bacterium]|nr:M20/M25/M40 family metallo-hydrolase [Chloroflexota bacterium]